MNIIEFEKKYKLLNTAQKEAVDTIDGPVMVVAGPGTGKTKTLTLRIANIVKQTDTEPENILAITFTEAGVSSMRRALVEILGPVAYAVNINTFHGFSNNIIKNYPEYFPKIIGSDAITDSDRIKIIEDIITNSDLKILKPQGSHFYYLKDIMGAISDLKREGIDVLDYQKIISDWRIKFESIEDLYYTSGRYKGKMKGEYITELKNINKNEDLYLIYASYEDMLNNKRLYDYEDMIIETLKAMRFNSDLLLSIQEKYQYILVDEHQDSNKAQNRILELLISFHDNPNIFIVGDEKQAIFRFQGASLDNFYFFQNLYPNAKLIILKENYRSTEEIVKGAYSLIPKNEELKSIIGKGDKIRLCEFNNEMAEEYFLVDDIKRKINSGEKASDIAILFKENQHALPIVKALTKHGVPFVLEPSNNLLADQDVRRIIIIMRSIINLENEFEITEAMHMSFFNISPIEIYKTLNLARASRAHIMEIIEQSDIEAIRNFGIKLLRWQIMAKNNNLLDLSEDIISQSNIMKEIMSCSNALHRIENISEFYSYIRNFVEQKKSATIYDFIEHLDTMINYGILIARKNSLLAHNKVRLMTAHRSKGQEFDSVYIIRAVNGIWDNKQKPEKFKLPYSIYSLLGREIEESEKIDDERKLFYVAITRAKTKLIITYSNKDKENKEQLPSKFIEEIQEDMMEKINTDYWNNNLTQYINILLDASPKINIEKEIQDIVRDALSTKGLSATDINNYIKCPWKYFYTGLFRIPEKSESHLIYGTAIHEALKDFFNSIKEYGIRKEYLLTRFKYYLNNGLLKDSEYKDFLKRGEQALSVYFEERKEDFDKDFLTELYIAGVEIAPGITIKGRIDRMEQIGFSNEFIVTDYKTGKAKSENEIMGKTKNADGNTKRQLIFYKLLLDGYKNGKYNMTLAQVDFVEPNEKGKCKRYNFSINQEEVSELKQEIIKIAEEIQSLSFWNKKCIDPDCIYCALRYEF